MPSNPLGPRRTRSTTFVGQSGWALSHRQAPNRPTSPLTSSRPLRLKNHQRASYRLHLPQLRRSTLQTRFRIFRSVSHGGTDGRHHGISIREMHRSRIRNIHAESKRHGRIPRRLLPWRIWVPSFVGLTDRWRRCWVRCHVRRHSFFSIFLCRRRFFDIRRWP